MRWYRVELKKRNTQFAIPPPSTAGPTGRLAALDGWDKFLSELIRAGFTEAVSLRAFQGKSKVIITGPRVVVQKAEAWREQIQAIVGQAVELKA